MQILKSTLLAVLLIAVSFGTEALAAVNKTGASIAAVGSNFFTPQDGDAPVLRRRDTRRRPGTRPRYTGNDERRGSGVGGAYRKAGARYGRGGKRFGKKVGGFGVDIAKARPIRAGRKLGQGAGSLGKNVGIGTGYVAVGTARAVGKGGKAVGKGVGKAAKATGKGIKRIFTP